MTKRGTYHGVPINRTRVTITGSDGNAPRGVPSDGPSLVIALARPGKETHVPIERDDDGLPDAWELQHVAVIRSSEYLLLPVDGGEILPNATAERIVKAIRDFHLDEQGLPLGDGED